jgi:drug/metabolite transporter (DMT)-like permease
MAEIPARPRKSELPWNYRPWVSMVLCGILLLLLVMSYLDDRSHWLAILAVQISGAIFGLIGVPAQIRNIDAGWDRRIGRRPARKESYFFVLLMFLASIVGFIIGRWSGIHDLHWDAIIAYIFVSMLISDYLWWRCLPE